MRQGFDPLHVIECASRHAGDRRAWWTCLADALAPQLDRGAGRLAYTLSLRKTHPIDIVNLGAPQASLDVTRQGAERVDRHEAILAVDPVGLFSNREVFGPLDLGEGVADALVLSVPDGEGAIHVLVTMSPRVEQVRDDERLMWRRLALHLGAALRLQRQAGTLDDPEIEAVLDPSGKLLHANGEHVDAASREHLRDAARRLDRMRGRGSDPHEVLEVWQGLLLGRWSMVDHFDSDGRRFLVARKNDPDAPTPRQLTRRQGQVTFYAALGLAHKQIGYALGIAETTVANHLRAALAKLGIEGRAALIHAAAQVLNSVEPA